MEADVERNIKVSNSRPLSKADKMADEQDKFLCSVCNKSFKYQSVLETHTRRHAGTEPYLCAVCNRGFNRRYQLTLHMKGHVSKEQFSCIECNKVFKYKSQLKNHTLITHTDQRPYSCKVCGETFKNASSVTWHMRSHSSDRPFSCSICQKRFKNKAGLTFHLKSLTEEDHLKLQKAEKPFSCTLCNSGFSTKMGLDNHQRMHQAIHSHSDKDQTTGSAVADQKIHSDEKAYYCTMCTVCCETFTSSTALTDHWKTHSKAGSICDKRTSRKPDETNHINSSVHWNHRKDEAGQKPFSCTICKKSFTRKQGLHIHQSIHTERKPCFCPHCDKVYKSSSSLTVHLKTHLEEKHSCTICHKTYSSDTALTLHWRSHKDKILYSCSICKLVFSKKEKLILHLKCHIGEKMPLMSLNTGKEKASHTGKEKPSHTGNDRTTNQLIVNTIGKTSDVTQVDFTKVVLNCPVLNLAGESKTFKVSQVNQSTYYTCFICEHAFTWYDLRMHLGVHTGEFLQCDRCDKIIQEDSDYILHRKTHKKESVKRARRRRIHPEIKPYPSIPTSYSCSVCSMRLPSIELLVFHLGTHTGEKMPLFPS